MAANVPLFKLNNGVLMPSVGLGCWMGAPGGGERVYKMVTNALKAKYRHIDTADGYNNEEEVGRAIRDSGVPRKDLFVTTKLNDTDHHRVSEAFDRSLGALDIGYIDLWLMHWPQSRKGGRCLAPDESPTIHETWAEMVKILDTGKSLLESTTVVPAVNQVELHPFLPQENIRKFCTEHGIVVTAYSPIGQPTSPRVSPLLTDETVGGIAKKHGVTEGQVVLSWAVKNGIIVVPKSENLERMKANISLVQLDDGDLTAIDEIHNNPDKHHSLVGYHSSDGTVSEWTYKQLGWDMDIGGKAKA